MEFVHENCVKRGTGKNGERLCVDSYIAGELRLKEYFGTVTDAPENGPAEVYHLLPTESNICAICRGHSGIWDLIQSQTDGIRVNLMREITEPGVSEEEKQRTHY